MIVVAFDIVISIHALREEGDVSPFTWLMLFARISIHALREEGDTGGEIQMGDAVKFLSTPSARRATAARSASRSGDLISIHALREEGDAAAIMAFTALVDFYPRPPRGGRLSQ